jgi:hypothetical protein
MQRPVTWYTGDVEDWSLAMPPDVPVLTYQPVPLEQRQKVEVGLVEDLVIGLDGPEESLLGQAGDVAVDANGQIYISDYVATNIKVFDRDGQFLRIQGQRGEGPGELRSILALATVRGQIVAIDHKARRLTIWDHDGRVVGVGTPTPGSLFAVDGAGDGLAGSYVAYRPAAGQDQGGFHRYFARFSVDGSTILEYARMKEWTQPYFRRDSPSGPLYVYADPVGTPRAWFASDDTGNVYLVAGDRYEILAFDDLGQAKWGLRVEWPLTELSPEEIEAAKAQLRESALEDEIKRIRWPETEPGLSRTRIAWEGGHPVRVSSDGLLFVFPYIPLPWVTDGRMRPVDVYTSEGQHVLSGMIPNYNWLATWGDFVYGIEVDPASAQSVVKRYRLVMPDVTRVRNSPNREREASTVR